MEVSISLTSSRRETELRVDREKQQRKENGLLYIICHSINLDIINMSNKKLERENERERENEKEREREKEKYINFCI